MMEDVNENCQKCGRYVGWEDLIYCQAYDEEYCYRCTHPDSEKCCN